MAERHDIVNLQVDIYLKKNWRVIVVVMSLLIAVAISFSIEQGQEKNILQVQKQYLKERNSKANVDETFHHLDFYEANKAALKDFDGQLPSNGQLPDKLKAITDILRQYQITNTAIHFKPETIDALSLCKYTSSITIQGAYGSLRNVLAQIQNLKGLFCIEKISFNYNRRLNNHDVNMNLTIATYCRP